MSNDAKSPEKQGEDAISLVENLTSQGVSVDAILKGMKPDAIHTFLVNQYNLLHEKYESMEEQLRKIEEDIQKDNQETTQRIERILALMTSNLTFIKQMIQLEGVNNDKLTDQEKINNRQELQMANLIDRQNRFAVSLTAMDKNNKTIMSEIEKLKAKDVEHDKFQVKVMTVASIIMAVITWLMTGDNLAKLTVFLVNFTGQQQ